MSLTNHPINLLKLILSFNLPCVSLTKSSLSNFSHHKKRSFKTLKPSFKFKLTYGLSSISVVFKQTLFKTRKESYGYLSSNG